MSDEKKYYWIKLRKDFFDKKAIDFILSQKNGCQYIVLYQMLCLNTANNNGYLYTQFDETLIPFNIEKIVRDTKYFDCDTVRVALEMYKSLGLIYEEENNIFRIANFNELVGKETKWAEYKRQQRLDNVQTMSNKSIESKSLDIKSLEEKNKDNKHIHTCVCHLNLTEKQKSCLECGKKNICTLKTSRSFIEKYKCNVEDYKNEVYEEKKGPIITYDPDGVMVWNGKRCESTPCTDEQLQEMENLLKDFK